MMMIISHEADRVGERELSSREPVAGGAGPFEGPEYQCVGERELSSREPVAGGAGPFRGPEYQ
jgi:hypothetical protein